MNKKGIIGVFPMMGLALLAFLVIPAALFYLSTISKIMFQVIMAFMIIAYVKNFGIEGPLMWILSGILVYFLVWKYPTMTASFYMLILMMGMGFTSAIIWGSSSIRTFFVTKKAKANKK